MSPYSAASAAPTIGQGLSRSASVGSGRVVFHLEGGQVVLTPAELDEWSRAGAAHLRSLGMGRGKAVGLLGTNHPSWATWALSVWRSGAALVPLAIPFRVRDPGAFAEQVASLAHAAGCGLVIAHPDLLWAVPDGLGISWDTEPSASAGSGSSAAADGDEVSPDDVAVVQLTSGSTASPKGAVLTHAAVMAAMRAATNDYEMSASSVLVNWLPLFHDFGLFGSLLAPIMGGSESNLLSPQLFVRDPAIWLRELSKCGGTIALGPPSAWNASLRAAEKSETGLDLAPMTLAVQAAETIDPDGVERLIAWGKEFGLPFGAVAGAYGLAEATLGVTSSRPMEGMRLLDVDLATLVAEGRAVDARGGAVKRLASAGRPMLDIEVRIDGGARPVPDRTIGEIMVRGGSLMTGYVGEDAPDPFVAGWLGTGDLGFLDGGELFVTGRIKDMLIVLGHNYYPEDLEWAADRVEGVRIGRSVAFQRPGGEEGEVVVAVEPSADMDPEALPTVVRNKVADAVGIIPREVIVLAAGTIEKTTSGKLRRSALSHRYANGELDPLATLAKRS